jgi:Fur family ferric uptake transcriptional regulator
MNEALVITILDRAGYRLTEPRRRLGRIDRGRAGRPFHGRGPVAEARAGRLRVGRATVFRTLEVLEELGAVERLDLPTGEHAYVVCQRAHHHHHIVCSSCGRTIQIDDAGLRIVVGEIARRTGYRVDEHRLELFGMCPSCLASQPGPTTVSA